jgi:ligand-binding SRPBCC domain-containing protein
MAFIKLELWIEAPVQRVFDLSRSIDLHQASMQHTHEKAVAGVTSGLINLNETVTWQAKHLFKTRVMTSCITAMKTPESFTDEQIKGDFKKWEHHHYFKSNYNKTLMIDEVNFESPFGIFGKFANFIFLKNYMSQLLKKRNETIKAIAESDDWKRFL